MGRSSIAWVEDLVNRAFWNGLFYGLSVGIPCGALLTVLLQYVKERS